MYTDSDEIFKGRIRELSDKAACRGCFMFTDFLDMAQQSYILQNKRSLSAQVTFYGGYDRAQRVIAGFGSMDETGREILFPIKILHIKPLNPRFSDRLTHRDFLGAILNLGIERRLTGDILTDGTQGWVFVQEHIASFIEEALTHIKHTSVEVSITDCIPDGIITDPEQMCLIVPSLRLDALVSRVFNLSRKEAEKLFNSEKVFINSRICTKTAHTLYEGDIVSVRGFGRFRYVEADGNTRKGNIKIIIEKY